MANVSNNNVPSQPNSTPTVHITPLSSPPPQAFFFTASGNQTVSAEVQTRANAAFNSLKSLVLNQLNKTDAVDFSWKIGIQVFTFTHHGTTYSHDIREIETALSGDASKQMYFKEQMKIIHGIFEKEILKGDAFITPHPFHQEHAGLFSSEIRHIDSSSWRKHDKERKIPQGIPNRAKGDAFQAKIASRYGGDDNASQRKCIEARYLLLASTTHSLKTSLDETKVKLEDQLTDPQLAQTTRTTLTDQLNHITNLEEALNTLDLNALEEALLAYPTEKDPSGEEIKKAAEAVHQALERGCQGASSEYLSEASALVFEGWTKIGEQRELKLQHMHTHKSSPKELSLEELLFAAVLKPDQNHTLLTEWIHKTGIVSEWKEKLSVRAQYLKDHRHAVAVGANAPTPPSPSEALPTTPPVTPSLEHMKSLVQQEWSSLTGTPATSPPTLNLGYPEKGVPNLDSIDHFKKLVLEKFPDAPEKQRQAMEYYSQLVVGATSIKNAVSWAKSFLEAAASSQDASQSVPQIQIDALNQLDQDLQNMNLFRLEQVILVLVAENIEEKGALEAQWKSNIVSNLLAAERQRSYLEHTPSFNEQALKNIFDTLLSAVQEKLVDAPAQASSVPSVQGQPTLDALLLGFSFLPLYRMEPLEQRLDLIVGFKDIVLGRIKDISKELPKEPHLSLDEFVAKLKQIIKPAKEASASTATVEEEESSDEI